MTKSSSYGGYYDCGLAAECTVNRQIDGYLKYAIFLYRGEYPTLS